MKTILKIYFDAGQVAEMLDISKASAYGIIRQLNGELEAKGFLVVQGKISRAYFCERWYGGTENVKIDVVQGG